MPETIAQYMAVEDIEAANTRNAMFLYAYIKSGVISHGGAAELLGMHKLDLIVLYGKLGINYIDMTDDEFAEEMDMVKKLGEMMP